MVAKHLSQRLSFPGKPQPQVSVFVFGLNTLYFFHVISYLSLPLDCKLLEHRTGPSCYSFLYFWALALVHTKLSQCPFTLVIELPNPKMHDQHFWSASVQVQLSSLRCHQIHVTLSLASLHSPSQPLHCRQAAKMQVDKGSFGEATASTTVLQCYKIHAPTCQTFPRTSQL